jgi:signal transduction histidine kinase
VTLRSTLHEFRPGSLDGGGGVLDNHQTVGESGEAEREHGWGDLGPGLERAPVPALLEALDPVEALALNPALAALLGVARSALVGAPPGPRRHAWCAALEREALVAEARAHGGRAAGELALSRFDGTRVPCIAEVSLLTGEGRTRALWFFRERATGRRPHPVLEGLLDNTDDLIAAYDRDIRLLEFNQACARAYREVLGIELRVGLRTLDLFPPAMRPFWESANARALSGEVFSIEFDVPAPDGARTFESSYTPIREHDAVVGFWTFTRDVTRRKRAEDERHRLEARLRQTQKMEAVGALAGGIAHDFNNLLQVIEFSAYEGVELTGGHGPLAALLRSIVDTTERGAELTRRLTRFAHPSDEDLAPFELATLVRDGVRMLRRSLAPTVTIEIEPCDQPVTVLGADGQIHQALVNLVLNAAQAMDPGGGRVRIQVGQLHLDDSDARDLEVEPGPYARLVVSDTGHGMDDATLARIFDPFFSTRTRDRNSGLGLTMVQSIVKAHRGAVRARSRVGEGASFEVFLRLADEASAPEARPIAPEPGPIAGRVLVVDDDPWVLAVTESWLARVGFTVSAHTKSDEALAEFEADPGAWDAVVTDVVMPPPTGPDLLRRMLELRPDARVVLVSGYGGELDERGAKDAGAVAFLMKPVSREALVRAITGA